MTDGDTKLDEYVTPTVLAPLVAEETGIAPEDVRRVLQAAMRFGAVAPFDDLLRDGDQWSWTRLCIELIPRFDLRPIVIWPNGSDSPVLRLIPVDASEEDCKQNRCVRVEFPDNGGVIRTYWPEKNLFLSADTVYETFRHLRTILETMPAT